MSVDRFPLGDGRVAPLTRRLSSAYMDLVRGIDKSHGGWRTAVYGARGAAKVPVGAR